MPTMLTILVTLFVLILIPWTIRNILLLVFAIQVMRKHGLLFPSDSKIDKAILDQEARDGWFDTFDAVVRPFSWDYWIQGMRPNKK